MADSGNFNAWLNCLLAIQTEVGRKAAFEGPGAQEFSYGSGVRRKHINLAVKFELKRIPRG
jgi:hypothetical protein